MNKYTRSFIGLMEQDDNGSWCKVDEAEAEIQALHKGVKQEWLLREQERRINYNLNDKIERMESMAKVHNSLIVLLAIVSIILALNLAKCASWLG
jgi:hypothetical protein